MRDDLGNRMKVYEKATRTYLTRRLPVIIRIDGKAFHTFTKGFEKPFDNLLMRAMRETTKELCKNIQGCKVGYTQSDEISLLITDYENVNSCAWFDNNIQKMVSISASIATLAFNRAFSNLVNEEIHKYMKYGNGRFTEEDEKLYNQIMTYKKREMVALFDSRVFTLPKEEVNNYFIWRQNDASRNSVQMVGRANFSHKQLDRKSGKEIQEMLFQEKGINWDKLPTYQKRGACIVKEKYEIEDGNNTIRNRWVVDKDIPLFTQDRTYIEKYV